MSINFLIVCVAMIVAALTLLLVPLLRNVPGEGTDKTPPPRAVPMAVLLICAATLPVAAMLSWVGQPDAALERLGSNQLVRHFLMAHTEQLQNAASVVPGGQPGHDLFEAIDATDLPHEAVVVE